MHTFQYIFVKREPREKHNIPIMAICEKGRSRDFSRELWVNFCLNKILFKNPQGTKKYIFSENFIYSIFKIIFFASFNVQVKKSHMITLSRDCGNMEGVFRCIAILSCFCLALSTKVPVLLWSSSR